jgi:hypothetical protein
MNYQLAPFEYDVYKIRNVDDEVFLLLNSGSGPNTLYIAGMDINPRSSSYFWSVLRTYSNVQ